MFKLLTSLGSETEELVVMHYLVHNLQCTNTKCDISKHTLRDMTGATDEYIEKNARNTRGF